MKTIKLKINKEEYDISVEQNWTLLYVLREKLSLTGTKCGCEMGDCGACTVIMNGEAVNSCLVLAMEADGGCIETIEGMAHNDQLAPLQSAFVEHGAIQCGFCTPGMIMTSKALLDENPHPNSETIRYGLYGNICRCTGYTKIIEAVKAVAEME